MKKPHEYILKEGEIFVGLEDSKKTWTLCVRSGGVIVHETSMPARYEVLRNYFRKRFPECGITVIYEAGFKGFGLHDRLVADGYGCVVTPPHTVTEEKCNRKKNEKIDCRRLARNLENGDYRRCSVPDKTRREDRQISRTCRQVQTDIVRVCNRIRRTLEFHGLDDVFPGQRWSERMYRELGRELEGKDISPSLKLSLDLMLGELEHLRQRRLQLWQELRRLARSERYQESVKLLKSAPGIGTLTAIRLVLEWGDVSRFKTKADFVSFLGLCPSDYSTGEQYRKGHITKQGNPQIRTWLVESSWIAIRRDPVLLEKYQGVYKRCGSKKKAIVAVARKLALRLRRLLLTGESYAIGVVE